MLRDSCIYCFLYHFPASLPSSCSLSLFSPSSILHIAARMFFWKWKWGPDIVPLSFESVLSLCSGIFYYLFIWLRQVLVVACGIFSCSMWTLSCSIWDLVPQTEIKPGPPALREWNLSHWTTREVPVSNVYIALHDLSGSAFWLNPGNLNSFIHLPFSIHCCIFFSRLRLPARLSLLPRTLLSHFCLAGFFASFSDRPK